MIESIHSFEKQKDENFWFFSEALVDHAFLMRQSEYIAFSSPLMDYFKLLCKTKKTKFVKNYLKMLINLVSSDDKAYDVFLKYEVFLNLDFCLENRFPEVKGLCADIGCYLIDGFGVKLDIENIGFFSELATAFLEF